MSKMVSHTIDIDNPPPLTPKQEEELKRLELIRDEDIDLSDIPEMKFENVIRWRDRHLHPDFYKPLKRSTTVRVDADVLAWLKAKGHGYQTRLNAILREAMLRDRERPDQAR